MISRHSEGGPLAERRCCAYASVSVTAVFVAAIVIFVIQNGEMVTISFLGFSLRAPLAILAVIVYVLGAITGGSVTPSNRFAFFARSTLSALSA